jgi:hypothetical protein
MSSLQRRREAQQAFQFTENDSSEEEQDAGAVVAETIELLSSDSEEEQDGIGEGNLGAVLVGGRHLRRRRPLLQEEPQDFQINLERMRTRSYATNARARLNLHHQHSHILSPFFK